MVVSPAGGHLIEKREDARSPCLSVSSLVSCLSCWPLYDDAVLFLSMERCTARRNVRFFSVCKQCFFFAGIGLCVSRAYRERVRGRPFSRHSCLLCPALSVITPRNIHPIMMLYCTLTASRGIYPQHIQSETEQHPLYKPPFRCTAFILQYVRGSIIYSARKQPPLCGMCFARVVDNTWMTL